MSGCIQSIGPRAKDNIEDNKVKALETLESGIINEQEIIESEGFFVSILTDMINNTGNLFIKYQDLEENYISKKTENLTQDQDGNDTITKNFKNILSFFVANGLLLVPQEGILLVNEEQLKRITSRFVEHNGKAYTKVPRK